MTKLQTTIVTALAGLSVGVAGIFLIPNKADARGGCYRSLAANDIATMIRGGASPERAIRFAVENGNINSESCLTSTIGYMRGLPYVFGDVLR